MSPTVSPAVDRVYGLARVCRIWRVPRATLYRRRHSETIRPRHPETERPRHPPSRIGPMRDAELVEAISESSAESTFNGEDYRKIPPGPPGPVPSVKRIDRRLTIDGRTCASRASAPPSGASCG